MFSIVTKTLWTNPGVIGSVLNAQLKAPAAGGGGPEAGVRPDRPAA
jgi:hypothetical protein